MNSTFKAFNNKNKLLIKLIKFKKMNLKSEIHKKITKLAKYYGKVCPFLPALIITCSCTTFWCYRMSFVHKLNFWKIKSFMKFMKKLYKTLSLILSLDNSFKIMSLTINKLSIKFMIRLKERFIFFKHWENLPWYQALILTQNQLILINFWLILSTIDIK